MLIGRGSWSQCGESCPSGQRRGPAAPGEDNFLSPDQKFFHTSTTPTTRGWKRRSPDRYRPAGCGNPHPTGWLLIGCVRLIEPERGESCPCGRRRGPAAPSEDKVLSPGENFPHISATLTTWGRKQRSPGLIPPRKVWKPQTHRVIADWLGLMAPARGESCPSGQRRGHAAPGEDNFPSPDQKSFHTSTTPITRG